jgi:hypothetical protein
MISLFRLARTLPTQCLTKLSCFARIGLKNAHKQVRAKTGCSLLRALHNFAHNHGNAWYVGLEQVEKQRVILCAAQ